MKYQTSKNIDGINYSISINEKNIICGEYEDNPHGLNNEVSCSLKAFINNSGENATRCHSLIKQYFGNKEFEKAVKLVKAYLSK